MYKWAEHPNPTLSCCLYKSFKIYCQTPWNEIKNPVWENLSSHSEPNGPDENLTDVNIYIINPFRLPESNENTFFSYLTYVLNTTCLQHAVQNIEECKIASPEPKTYLNF